MAKFIAKDFCVNDFLKLFDDYKNQYKVSKHLGCSFCKKNIL